ncbi:DsbA family protein [Pseudorhodobacter wandonensis]|jgi:protein-disulfide isomerase|uniref:DsbA family protein n=1 Tax=Pseudorhodobacter wandonensis TaxID=1120568 RepID=UPI00067B7310
MNRREFSIALAAGMAVAAVPVWAQDAAAPVLPEVPDMVLGNPESKVVLTEYASYTCPHCANFHSEVFKDLKRDYIDTGKIKFVYREVFFDRYGLWAAMIARCGGDLRYFGIQDMIYSTQKEWAASQDPAAIIENLRRLGRTAGLEDAAMDVCLNDAAMAQAMVEKFQKDTEADGINSTPSFILNGVKHSNMNYADLKALLDAELAK